MISNYIFIQPKQICIQENIFSLYHLFFMISKYCHSAKKNFYSVRNISIIYIYFFIQVKNIFKEFYFQYVNGTTAWGCEKAAKKDIRILCY